MYDVTLSLRHENSLTYLTFSFRCEKGCENNDQCPIGEMCALVSLVASPSVTAVPPPSNLNVDVDILRDKIKISLSTSTAGGEVRKASGNSVH